MITKMIIEIVFMSMLLGGAYLAQREFTEFNEFKVISSSLEVLSWSFIF